MVPFFTTLSVYNYLSEYYFYKVAIVLVSLPTLLRHANEPWLALGDCFLRITIDMLRDVFLHVWCFFRLKQARRAYDLKLGVAGAFIVR